MIHESSSRIGLHLKVPPLKIIIISLLIIISTLLLSTFSYSKEYTLSSLLARLKGNSGYWHLGNGMKLIRYRPPSNLRTGLSTRRKAKAVFVVLVRNSELNDIVLSLRGVEERFNKNYNYPYLFLNDQPFTEEFKAFTTQVTSGECTYTQIDSSQWDDQPDWIDQEKARLNREEMTREGTIPYADSIAYRKMCRYQSGFFWRHPLLDKYSYYWRIEPHVKFSCDINYDPFLFMQDNNKKYGFTLSIKEYVRTIPTLWKETKDFIEQNPQYLAKPNSMNWVSNDRGESYNLCHFWSNFEIASLDFWRSDAYRSYFDHLDKSGGFFYERWGDAPVHSIAAALFLKPEEIHFFQDIGYRHTPFQHCPKNRPDDCSCNPNSRDSFEGDDYSCTTEWKEFVKWKDL